MCSIRALATQARLGLLVGCDGEGGSSKRSCCRVLTVAVTRFKIAFLLLLNEARDKQCTSFNGDRNCSLTVQTIDRCECLLCLSRRLSGWLAALA